MANIARMVGSLTRDKKSDVKMASHLINLHNALLERNRQQNLADINESSFKINILLIQCVFLEWKITKYFFSLAKVH